MAEVPLREVVANWPPTAGAGLRDAPIVELTDVIEQASVSREGHLVLSLSRDEDSFTAAERIPDDQIDAIRRLISQLREQTIEAAGDLVINADG